MPIKIVTCGADLPDGTRCGQRACLEDVRYVYQERLIDNCVEQALVETHYTIHCPTCGWWTLIETNEP